jgi:diacylglycerol O-acyltransferase
MSKPVHGEPITAVDRAWLEMDEPHNPMVVSAILELSDVEDIEQLSRRILEGLLRYRRFSQRADEHGSGLIWRDDGPLTVAYHLRIYHLNEDRPEHDLRHAVARELAAVLDRTMPLWRMTFFVRHPRQVTVLFRAHHAVADGIALIRVLMSCTDDALAQVTHAAGRPQHHGPLARLIEGLETINRQLESAQQLIRADMRHPAQIIEQLRAGRAAIAAAGRVLSLPDDNPACFRRPLEGLRAVAWTRGIEFAPIKRYARRHASKINDVFVSALAGAFTRYLRRSQPDAARWHNLRISVPVNLRSEDDAELGNRFGLVLLDLPLGIEDPVERLRIVAERALALKHSPEAQATLVGLGAAGHMPLALEKRLINFLADKAAAVVSNLPGPRQVLRFAGSKLNSVVFWPPQTGHIGIGVSLFSYAGHVSVGVSSDVALIPDPEALVADFEAELAALLQPRRRRQPAARRR